MGGQRFWVPGGTGLVGQAVCAALVQYKHTVCATGSEVDIADPDSVAAHLQHNPCDAIINCAAMTQVDLCETEAERAMRINGRGPEVLALAAREHGAAVVHISSDYVFDGASPEPRTEGHPVGPQSAYGHSKLAGESAFLAALAGHSKPYFVVRTSWVFGPHGGNFVATMLRLMGERDVVQVVNDQHGRPTYTPDLARALLSLLGADGGAACPSGVYHFANGGHTTWHGLCVEVLAAAQAIGLPMRCQTVQPVTTEAFPRPAKRPAYSVLSTQKFEAAAKWAPQPFAEAVAHYLGAVSQP
jgi:dTDP-4-dehydrorhamnose reductase